MPLLVRWFFCRGRGVSSEIGETMLILCIMIVLISRSVVDLHVFFIF